MDSSEEHPVTIELQCPTDVCHDTESVPDFLNNLRLSDLYNLPGESVAMHSEISSTVRHGTIRNLVEWMTTNYGTPMACFKNDKGDSILHLAASLGHTKLVETIVSECPSLLLETNWKHQIPLHVAALAGHLAVVKVIATSIEFFAARLPEEDRERLNLFGVKDINGDTPLHLALKDFQEKTELLLRNQKPPHYPVILRWRGCSRSSFSDASARLMDTTACLVNANRCVSFLANKDGISPLYLAVKAGNLSLVNAMLSCPGNSAHRITSDLASKLEGRKSLVHAALMAKNIDVLDVILNADPSLVNDRDEEGQTCLSVGASVGFCEGIKKLLDRSTSSVFECDHDGSFPIHKAVKNGHLDVVKDLLSRFPDSIEQLNNKGQNILHIAAISGKKTVEYLMKRIQRFQVKNHLIVEQDVDGNTPLHLATIYWRPQCVFFLTDFGATETNVLNIQNKDGLRALDIAEIKLQSNYIFRERLTLMVLLSDYKPKGFSWTPTSGMTLRSKSEHLAGGEKFKDLINVLLLVAALVATVTFAAGFTMPGGFNSSAPNAGMAILANARNLRFFLVYDTLAMQSSLITIIALIWAQLGDPELAYRAFHLALPSLFFSLYCMSSAFCFGVVVTLSTNTLLSIAIYIISTLMTGMMITLFTPYVIPLVYSIPLIHYLSLVYLFTLLWLVNEDDASVSAHNRLEISSGDQEENSKVS